MIETAKTSPKDSVRVVWTSSNAAELFAPKEGVEMGNLDYGEEKGAWFKYGVSKAGNVYHASEFARRCGGEGIVSVVSNEFINGLKSESRVFPPFLEKIVVLMTGLCNNRASIPAGSRRIYRDMCPGM